MKKKKKTSYPAVMLIDDNEIDNYINERMIRGCSFSEKIYINTGAKSALEFLKNLSILGESPELFPDIIFLDINMPLMDGFSFLEEYEKMNLTWKTSKIVFLTSSINPEDEKKSRRYTNVSAFVRKPLNENTLKKLSEK